MDVRREDCCAEIVLASCEGVVGRSMLRAKDSEGARGVRGRRADAADAAAATGPSDSDLKRLLVSPDMCEEKDARQRRGSLRSIVAVFGLHDAFPRFRLRFLIATRSSPGCCAGAAIALDRGAQSLIEAFQFGVAAQPCLVFSQVLIKGNFKLGFEEGVEAAREDGSVSRMLRGKNNIHGIWWGRVLTLSGRRNRRGRSARFCAASAASN